jgi:hypothetical protein
VPEKGHVAGLPMQLIGPMMLKPPKSKVTESAVI